MVWMSLLTFGQELTLDNVKTLSDIAQKLFTIFAIIVGGYWAYFNFVKGRVYTPRLELKVSGEVTLVGDTTYLLVTGEANNVGLTWFRNTEEPTLSVLWCEVEDGVIAPETVEWKEFPGEPAWPLFEAHKWIEPGETIEDKRMIMIPGRHYFSLQPRLVVRTTRFRWSWRPPFLRRWQTVWTASDVVYLTGEGDSRNNSSEYDTRTAENNQAGRRTIGRTGWRLWWRFR